MSDFLGNAFDETEPILMHRFSTLIIAVFAYYAMIYYGAVKYTLNCPNIPNYSSIILLIGFHIVQVVILFKLHQDENTFWAVIVAFGPVFLWLVMMKYNKYQKQQQTERMTQMLYQLQQNNQPNIATSGFPIPPQQPIPQQMSQNFLPSPPVQQIIPSQLDNVLQTPPQNLTNSQMQTIMNSNQIPGYGDYVHTYNPVTNRLPQQYSQPYSLSPF